MAFQSGFEIRHLPDILRRRNVRWVPDVWVHLSRSLGERWSHGLVFRSNELYDKYGSLRVVILYPIGTVVLLGHLIDKEQT